MQTLQITQQDIAEARRVYWWLLLAPIVAVPVFLTISSIVSLTSVSNSVNFGGALFSAAVPLFFYLPVFFWAFSGNPFLRAHARQACFLLALRFFSAFLYGVSGNAACFWVLANGALWLFGSVTGLNQAFRGYAWLDGLQAEILPDASHPPIRTASQPGAAAGPETTASYLKAFNSSDPAERQAALDKLEALCQVEVF